MDRVWQLYINSIVMINLEEVRTHLDSTSFNHQFLNRYFDWETSRANTLVKLILFIRYLL